jgi:DNA gyrase/topoisomerase IV subunit A
VGPETAAAYETGNGSVVLRATGHIEYEGSGGKKRGSSTKARKSTASAAVREAAEGAAAAAAAAGGKALVVFTEMPYQVCKVGAWLMHDDCVAACKLATDHCLQVGSLPYARVS